jgi:hypothetical protein
MNGKRLVVIAVVSVALTPAAVRAQSAIAGVVKDTSGAVLPGVTVEAASDVLIERTRTVATNGQGQYSIVDLRPGVYLVTFTLTGFQTIKRADLELPANFTATINVELRVGAIEESVTVAGSSPVVDVQSTSRTTVLSRDILDAVPTGRTIQGLGQLVVGVSLSVPDVGGSRAMQQTYMSVHGLSSSQVTVQVDGLMVNGLDGDGAVQNYFNNAMSQEMSYQTSGAGADVSGGGVRLNMIPREGGNSFSGSFFGAWSDGRWQSDNFSRSLQDRGLRATDKIDRIYDANFAQGGPIKRDTLWFFGSARRWSVDAPIADTFYADGKQGIDDQHIKSAMLRVTWQASPRHKLAGYYDRVGKDRGHGMTAGDDPQTASQVWNSPNYSTGSIKWTMAASNRMLVEGGYSFNIERYNIRNQEGITKPRGTAEWYAGASRRDLNLGTHYASLDFEQGQYPDRYNAQGAVSYVTGSHNIKVGSQLSWGPYTRTRNGNADLVQRYRNGVPDSVEILNTPIRWTDTLNADLGMFGQDSWTLKRLTVNAGARWEYFNSEVSEQTAPAGRFVPERRFDAIQMPTWKDFAPRLGIAYDLFGNAKTAVKFSISRFNQAGTINFADTFNPLVLTRAVVSWTDLNRNDIADGELGCVYLNAGCEINFAQLPQNFGVVAQNSPNPNNLLYCDATGSGIPFRTQFKLSGTYPLAWGIQVSGSFQSLPGYLLTATNFTTPSPTNLPSLTTPAGAGTVWLLSRTTRYAADCKGPCTPGALVIPNMTAANLAVPLIPPGTEFGDRVTQLDLSLAKWFALRSGRIQAQLDIFNVLNRGDVLAMRSMNFGTSSYLQPSSVLQARIIRIATQLKW